MEFTHNGYTVKVTQLKPEKVFNSQFSISNHGPVFIQVPGYYIFLVDNNPQGKRDFQKFKKNGEAYALRVSQSPSRYVQYKLPVSI